MSSSLIGELPMLTILLCLNVGAILVVVLTTVRAAERVKLTTCRETFIRCNSLLAMPRLNGRNTVRVLVMIVCMMVSVVVVPHRPHMFLSSILALHALLLTLKSV